MATAAGTQRPATDNGLSGMKVQRLREVVVGCLSYLIAARFARLAATHPVSRILGDQDVASQLPELRKLVAGGLRAHPVAITVHEVPRSKCIHKGKVVRWKAVLWRTGGQPDSHCWSCSKE